MVNSKKEALQNINFISKSEKEECIEKFEKEEERKQIMKDKIKSMTFCRRADKW